MQKQLFTGFRQWNSKQIVPDAGGGFESVPWQYVHF